MARVLCALCALLTGVGIAAAAGPARGQQSTAEWSVLNVGQSWTRLTVARSPSNEYSLGVYNYGLALDQHISSGGRGVGTEVWGSKRVDGHCVTPRLTMRRGGAAVLHCGGARLWATPTWGTGNANSLRIRDDGMLVVRTADGHVVWSSHSGPALMGTGTRLAPGHWLRDCSTSRPCASVTMRRDGDLALTIGTRRAWHSDTHTAGASLVFRRTGALQVVGPRGNVLWASHTGGIGPASYVMVSGSPHYARLEICSLRNSKFRWYRG